MAQTCEVLNLVSGSRGDQDTSYDFFWMISNSKKNLDTIMNELTVAADGLGLEPEPKPELLRWTRSCSQESQEDMKSGCIGQDLQYQFSNSCPCNVASKASQVGL